MDNEQLNLMKKAAEYYYYYGKTQAVIAKELNISKPTVSRLLKRAKEHNYIKVQLQFPVSHRADVEQLIESKYGIKKATVFDTLTRETNLLMNEMAEDISEFLNKLIVDGSKIGLAWGRSLYALSQKLTGEPKKDVHVIQITGGVAANNMATNSEAILTNFARCYNAQWNMLPVPTIVDNESIANALREDRNIGYVLDMFSKLDIAIFSVGEIRPDALIVQAGYVDGKDYVQMKEKDVVGDITGNYIKADGTVYDRALDKRRLGITTEQLKRIPHKVCVSAGKQKTDVMKAALKGGFIDYLFTDMSIAEQLIK